ncbi:MAG: metallophosphoesterase [Actinobacteria bacterium]|nr:metallophosphoesterase [Actinomycetota bacterium]
MARTSFVISDLHLGAGDHLDEFDQDASFRSFLEAVGERRHSELIINGDFLDFVAVNLEKTSVKPFSRLGCREEESLAKLERILEAHRDCFAALRRFMESGHRLVLIPGNHDVDLFWPRVRERLLEEMGGPDSEHFHFAYTGFYREGGLYVEHGNQYYADSAFENFTHPFLRDPRTGELRLERSWSNCFLEYFANGMMSERNPFVNNVRPIPNMVFLGIQDESWWFKLVYGFKLARFMAKVGFPPFRKSRQLRTKSREGRLDTWGYSLRRALGFITGRARVELQGLEEAEMPIHHLPSEEAEEEGGREDGLHLDPLATREDALSSAARDLLLSDQGIDVVIFGHDHRYYSNEMQPVLEGKKGKYYINTGTWIPMLFLTRTRRQLRWRDLADQSLYQQLLTYATVKRGIHGQTASLRRFPPQTAHRETGH